MMQVEKNVQSKQDAIFKALIYSIFFIFVLLSLRYQYLLLSYREWGDESETIVAAKMMAAGMKLYAEIFNQHGPLTFLPGIITEMIGDYGIKGHRVSIALLQILAVFSIYNAPVLKSVTQKMIASAVSAVMIIVFLPDIFGHMYKYQTMAGILLVVIGSQYTIPAICCPHQLNRFRVILGTILIASLPFLAITYLPIAGLLFLASLRKQYLAHAIIGCFAGLLANILFLGIYGSFSGFLAFHLYLNAKILPLYTGLQPGWQLIVNAVRTATSDLAHFLSLIVILLGAAILAFKEKSFPWRTLFLVAGLCSLLMRGAGFHGMPYFYAILPLLVLTLSAMEDESRASKFVAIGLLLLLTLKVSLLLPGERQKLSSAQIPKETEFSQLVQLYTTKEDRIIAYSFQNFQYIASERLPASAHFFYFPWQEKYNENPKYGVLIDACEQIKESAPKVMSIDKWKVWDKYPWESYATCLQAFLDSSYQQVPDKPYYIRKDLIRDYDSFLAGSEGKKKIASPPLSKAQPIHLKPFQYLTSPHEDRRLTGLDILFGTYIRVNPGAARLILTRASGSNYEVDFSLPDLQDNRYKHFDLPEDAYVAGKIESLTGGGISAWESHSQDGKAFTCLMFIFSDGSRGLTPGCPMF